MPKTRTPRRARMRAATRSYTGRWGHQSRYRVIETLRVASTCGARTHYEWRAARALEAN